MRKTPSILFLIITFWFLRSARSEEYTVGDDEGWTSQANFLTWSEKYNFSVGDILVFKYVPVHHNVYEVEEKTFRSCDPSSGVLGKHESGNDRVRLAEAKKYWFICNVEGHCLGGMRFGVDVKQVDENHHIINSPSSQPNEQVPQTSSCLTTYFLIESWRIGVFFVGVFEFFFKLDWLF